MSLSKLAKSFEVLIVGRLVFGVFCGLVMSMNPLYVQEVSPTNLRGAFATLNQVAYTLGILIGMVRTLTLQLSSGICGGKCPFGHRLVIVIVSYISLFSKPA